MVIDINTKTMSILLFLNFQNLHLLQVNLILVQTVILTEGMVNITNACNITLTQVSSKVTDVQLVFKEARL